MSEQPMGADRAQPTAGSVMAEICASGVDYTTTDASGNLMPETPHIESAQERAARRREGVRRIGAVIEQEGLPY